MEMDIKFYMEIQVENGKLIQKLERNFMKITEIVMRNNGNCEIAKIKK